MINPASPNLIEYFREALGPCDVASVDISGPIARMLADAIEIADSCARSDIECNLPQWDGWYDTSDLSVAAADADDIWLKQTLRHLDARGMIEREPDLPHLIRFVKAPA